MACSLDWTVGFYSFRSRVFGIRCILRPSWGSELPLLVLFPGLHHDKRGDHFNQSIIIIYARLC